MEAAAVATVSATEKAPLEVVAASAAVGAATVSVALEALVVLAALAELEERSLKRPPHQVANQTARCASGSRPVRVLATASSELTQS